MTYVKVYGIIPLYEMYGGVFYGWPKIENCK